MKTLKLKLYQTFDNYTKRGGFSFYIYLLKTKNCEASEKKHFSAPAAGFLDVFFSGKMGEGGGPRPFFPEKKRLKNHAGTPHPEKTAA